ncbi:hypothetical protein D3C83_170970 [compost metagenome]
MDASNTKEVTVRAGAYGEHQFQKVNGEAADSNLLRVRLAPGAGGTLDLGMKLFANSPTAPQP